MMDEPTMTWAERQSCDAEIMEIMAAGARGMLGQFAESAWLLSADASCLPAGMRTPAGWEAHGNYHDLLGRVALRFADLLASVQNLADDASEAAKSLRDASERPAAQGQSPHSGRFPSD